MKIRDFIFLFFVSIPSALIVAIYTSQNPQLTLQKNVLAHISAKKAENLKTIILDTVNVQYVPTPTVFVPEPKDIDNNSVVTPLQTNGTSVDNENSQEWGVAKKIDEHTYTIKVAYDNKMTSPQEVIDALNSYRAVHGKGSLSYDGRLGDYAQTRVETYKNIGTTDSHAGFEHLINNEDGFSKLGFNSLGENSYYGGPLEASHLIEWAFAQSPGHDANQLGDWTHVGVGVNETAVNIIFGGN